MDPFNVITSEDQLVATNGVSQSRFQQVSASRDVSANSFAGKQISYKFSTAANQWFSPKDSYLRARCILTKGDGNPLDLSDGIAPNSGMLAHLFQSMEVRINGVVVSRCTDSVAQVDALVHRSTKSKTWLESIGASVNFYGDDWDKRRADVSVDGVIPRSSARATPLTTALGTAADIRAELNAPARTTASRRLVGFELTWDMAPLSLFRSENNIPPGCDIELVLNPFGGSQYKNNAIHSLVGVAPKVGVNDNQFDFSVESLILYAKIYEGKSYDNGSAVLDLTNVSCHVESDGGKKAFGTKTFDVSPSTNMLTVAFQDTRLTDSTHSAAEFTVGDSTAVSPGYHNELELNRLFIAYDGQNHPQPDAAPEFDTTKDHTVQRYLETQTAIGAYDSESGGETLQQWQDRGAYYAFKFDRDGRSAATRAVVHTGFANAVANCRMLMFDHSYANCRLDFVNGRCVNVRVESA
jgi:hypothetical protein